MNDVGTVAAAGASPRALAASFAHEPIALAALVALVVIVMASAAAPLLTVQNPYDLAQLDVMDSRLPPTSRGQDGTLHVLGTDDQGRDMLSAILYGLRVSLAVALVATAIALSLGLAVGLVAAYAGGWVDAAIMRLVDLQLSFPAILIALVLLALLGPGVDKIVIALVTVQWAYYARTVRAAALVERRKEYVDAAVCLAYGTPRILYRHILPNCLPPLVVLASVQIAHAIALEATLSFLGLGMPITSPSLGLLVANGYTHLFAGRYWMSFFPGLALLAAIVAINLVADHLRDILNPRLH
jgi:peptide/nickel transport system permease protein